MTYAETAKLASALSVNDAVRAIADPGGLSRVYGDGTTSTKLPTVKSITQVTAVDGAFGGSGSTVNGQLKLTLTPATTDTVNSSSPLQPAVSQQAVVITATG